MVYLFEGEEEFLKQEALEELEQKIFKKGVKEFDKTIFYGQDMDSSELVNIAAVLPMLSQKRLIIIKEAEKISSAAREDLIPYVKKPSPFTCLVLDAVSLNKHSRLRNSISEYGKIVAFRKYHSNQIDKWIIKKVHLYKKKILPQAVAMLRENAGDSLKSLDESIKKLVLYVGKNEIIKADDVEEIIGRSVTATIFDLINVIRQKKQSQALKMLSQLIEEGKETSGIIGLIFWQLKRIKQAKKLLRQKVSLKEIGRQLKVHSFFLDKFITGVKNFSNREFNHHFELLLKADSEIKTGIRKPQITLELLIIKLCS
ncbi:MAG: DNA polymerase III subunit delta [Candidatus Omnitrophota bacterium]|nr:DNA polymerase III subunit delta [Candidatus Omnitrophota bacterium]